MTSSFSSIGGLDDGEDYCFKDVKSINTSQITRNSLGSNKVSTKSLTCEFIIGSNPVWDWGLKTLPFTLLPVSSYDGREKNSLSMQIYACHFSTLHFTYFRLQSLKRHHSNSFQCGFWCSFEGNKCKAKQTKLFSWDKSMVLF